jgi:HPt (histidine-containing phosphotransfer) domain-containing protein
MNERNIEERMCRLIEQLQALPSEYRDKLEDLCKSEPEQRSQIEENVSKLQDSLDYLRLSVKYMVFDLEATRRENVYLRKLVEQIRRDSTRGDEGNDNNFFFGGEDTD